MNRATKNGFIIDIRKLYRIIEQGEHVEFTAQESRETLANDRDHTEEWKKPRYEGITRRENEQLRELGKSAQVVCDSIMGALAKIESEFDFTDPTLQTALATINTLGDKTPYAVREQIAERFRGNPTALDMLLPLYEKHGFDTKAIKDMKEPLQSLGYRDREIMGEFIGRATSDMVEHNTWNPASVKRLLSSYEKAFGLDTSVNPYAVEIENLFDTTRDRNQKLTINAYRRKYGEKLATDDPEAIEEAERLLNNGFTGEVV